MMNLIKPLALKSGDKIATVSLSCGEKEIKSYYGGIIKVRKDCKRNLVLKLLRWNIL